MSLFCDIFNQISLWINVNKFKRSAALRKCYVGKPLELLCPEFISLGNKVRIKDNYRIACYPRFSRVELRPHLEIGDGVIINYSFTAFVADELYIGDDTIIAAGVTITTENHGIDPENDLPYHAQKLITAPVHIGKGCWIGQNAIILPGVNIGDKCVIAAGAVVNRSIPDYSICAGVPARVIKRYNFNNHTWERVD